MIWPNPRVPDRMQNRIKALEPPEGKPMKAITARFAALPDAFRALFWFLCAGTSFLAMMSCDRVLSGEL